MKHFYLSLLIVLILGVTNTAKAQFSVGPNLHYTTGLKTPGIGANVNYKINDTWWASANFTYFFKRKDYNDNYLYDPNFYWYLNWITVDINACYNIYEIDNVGLLYGYFGANIKYIRERFPEEKKDEFPVGYDPDSNSNEIGFNIGMALKFDLTKHISIHPDICATIQDESYLRIGVKLMLDI